GIAMHQRLCDRARTEDHQLCSEGVRIGNIKLYKQLAKRRPTLFLVSNCNLMGGMRALEKSSRSTADFPTAGWNASAQQPARDFGPDLG
ncbi:MAG: hypothetical protein WCF75_08040, partial [Pseudolabrys sp.]